MKVMNNLKVKDIFKSYVAFKYEGISRASSRPLSLTIGMDIGNNGHITSYQCCNEYSTFKEARAEADKTIIPFKPSTIWR